MRSAQDFCTDLLNKNERNEYVKGCCLNFRKRLCPVKNITKIIEVIKERREKKIIRSKSKHRYKTMLTFAWYF